MTMPPTWDLTTRAGRLAHGRALYRTLGFIAARRAAREPRPTPDDAAPWAPPGRAGRLLRGRRAADRARAPTRDPGPQPGFGPVVTALLGIAVLLGALGAELATHLLPSSRTLGLLAFATLIGPQLLNPGAAANDGTGTKGRVGALALNANAQRTLTGAAIYNAGTFAGATATDRITACNAAVVTDGGDGTFVPKYAGDGLKMLPYDASLVTFNNAVQMIREGGPSDSNLVDPEAFGVTSNYTVNGYAGLQAMFDWIAAQPAGAYATQGPAHVQLGHGLYRHDRPLWVKSPVRISGTGTGFQNAAPATRLRPTFMGGPALALQNASAVVGGLTTALVSGTGQAWNATVNSRFLSLRDYNYLLDVNGLSQFCIELYFKGTGHGVFVRSEGKATMADTQTSAFSLWNQPGPLQATLKLSTSGLVTVNGLDNVADNAVHECVLDYDGSTLRLWRDGVLAGSSAASGTVVQAVPEEVTVGVSIDRMPLQTLLFGHPNGTLDSIRISKVSRRTVGWTPGYAKYGNDINVLALLNFDEQIGAFTKMLNKDGTAWAWEYDQSSAFGFAGVVIEDLTIEGTGGETAIHTPSYGCFEWAVKNVHFLNLRSAIFSKGENYDMQINRVFANLGGGNTHARYGIVLGHVSGIGSIEDIWTQGMAFHGVLCGSGVRMARWFFQQDPYTHIGLLARTESGFGPANTLNQGLFNTEPGTTTGLYRCNLLIACPNAASGLHAIGCAFEGNAGALPLVVVDKNYRSKFDTCFFHTGDVVPTIMKALGTFTAPVLFDNCDQAQAGAKVPWTDIPGTATVGKIGKGLVLTFSASLTLDCSVRDEFEIGTLTGNVTLNLTNATPGQNLKIWTKQDATGGRTITLQKDGVAGNVKNATAATTTANQTNQWVFDAMLDGTVNQIAFTTGT